MSGNDGAFPGPDDFQEEPDDSPEETVGEAFAGYLGLIDETIRIQLTDDESGTGPAGPWTWRHPGRTRALITLGDPASVIVICSGTNSWR